MSPPQALITSDSGVFSFVSPSSETYPKLLNATSKSEAASTGNVVPNGAEKIAPPTFGFAVETFNALLMCLPPNNI